jgi:outer membrane protein assembly factor BamB
VGAIEARPCRRHDVIDGRCTRCGLCVPACPEHAIEVTPDAADGGPGRPVPLKAGGIISSGDVQMKGKAELIALLVTVSVAYAFAADWPQYYGPKRDSTSTEKGLLRTWPREGPKVLWTAPLGPGFGGPAVSRDKLYLLDRDEKVGDTLRVYDFATGQPLWTFAYDAQGSFMWPGSRTTPTVDGDFVYTCSPLGDLYAVNINTHKPVWHKNIWTDFGGSSAVPELRQPPPGMRGVQPSAPGGAPPPGPPGGPPRAPGGAGARAGAPPPPPPGGQAGRGGAAAPVLPTWAITQNPLIYRSLVIVASQAPEAGVVAYDKLTGELKWKTPALPGGAGYVSPSLVKVGGEDQLVMIMAAQGFGRSAGGGGVTGVDLASGKILWTYGGWQCGIPVPHAVDAGEGRVLVTGGYRAGAAMIKVRKKADGSDEVTELFKNPDFGSHTQPPILYKDHFYVQYTTNERSDGLVCMSMNGEVKWKTGEEPPFSKGGAVLADGLLLATDGNTKLYLIDPDPSGFKPLASAELLETGNNWAPLALVDGRLLIRDQKQLKCLAVAQQAR